MVQNRLIGLPEGLERVENSSWGSGTGREPSQLSGTGGGVLWKARDRLGGPSESLGRVKRPTQRSATGRGTLPEVWDGSVDTS